MSAKARHPVLGGVVALAVLAAPGLARGYQTAPPSGGNPDFRSLITRISPPTAGLRAKILGHDNLVDLVNRSRRDVVVKGYGGEPYARLRADGTVQLNLRSPAFYLNEYRFGDQAVPAYADPRAPAEWRSMDHSGRLTWHDHRAHWARPGRPPEAHDAHERRLLFAYRIPIEVGNRAGALRGELWWVGGAAGPGAGMMFALPLAGLLSTVLLARSLGRWRRRIA